MQGRVMIAGIAVSALFAAAAQAAPFQQGAGAHYIAFEAESFASSTVHDAGEPIFTIVDDSADGASGGLALSAADPDAGEAYTGTQPNTVTYELQFNQAGTYNVYIRGRGTNDGTGGNAGSDSIFAPDAWGNTAPQVSLDLPDAGPAGYLYRTPNSLVVAESDVGQVLTYSIGTREDEALVDRLVFTTQEYDIGYSDVTGPAAGHAELGALANSVPEPATLGLLSVGGLALLRRRRR